MMKFQRFQKIKYQVEHDCYFSDKRFYLTNKGLFKLRELNNYRFDFFLNKDRIFIKFNKNGDFCFRKRLRKSQIPQITCSCADFYNFISPTLNNQSKKFFLEKRGRNLFELVFVN